MSNSQLFSPFVKNFAIAALGALAGLFLSKAISNYFEQPVVNVNQNPCVPQHPINQSIVTFEEDSSREYD